MFREPTRRNGFSKMLPFVLVVDVGATTSRFALARKDGSLEAVRSIDNREAADLAAVLGAALESCAPLRPLSCVLAVAAPVDGDEVRLTNRAWSFSQRELCAALHLKRLTVVNDFAAIAHALPELRHADLVAFGGGRGVAGATMLVCGPGTGFGAATLQQHGGPPRAVPSEAGHMRLGAATADEARVLAHLVREDGPVAIEHVLSGPGLVRLHRILAGEETTSEAIVATARLGRNAARDTVHAFLRLFGRVAGDLALAFDARGGVFIAGGIGRVLAPFYAASPFREAFDEHPPQQARLGSNAARDTVHAFLRLFGRVAGDLALAFDARGGVFIAGGIGRVLAPFYASSPFREAFDEHPPYQARLAAIPVCVIAHAAPGLLGAARIAASLARD